jgi:hypothetical protein
MMISYDGTSTNAELNALFQTLAYEYLAIEAISVIT